MAETSRPWTTNGIGDGAARYSADQWAAVWRHLFGGYDASRGVVPGYGGGLAVSNPASTTIRVAAGAALVHGVWYELDAQVDFTPGDGTYPALPTNDQIHRVVLQKCWATQTVRLAFISGTDAVAPTTPALTQTDGTTWEIPLAQIRVDAAGNVDYVYDQRLPLGPAQMYLASVTYSAGDKPWNANQTYGLTVVQGLGTSAEEAISLKADVSQVNHGMTTLSETGTWFAVKRAANTGGAQLIGLGNIATYDAMALRAYLFAALADQTRGAASRGVMTYYAARVNGTGAQAVGNTENAFAWVNYTTRIAQMTGRGDLWLSGALSVNADVAGPVAGTDMTLSNSVNTGLGAGAGAIKMCGAGAHDNAGWLKFYIGSTPYWVPYWSVIVT